MVHAQRGADTVLKGSTIEVTQSYKPKVKQAPKPEWKPAMPAVDTSRPRLNFDVPQQTLYYAYNSTPLRPLALGKNTGEQAYPNYVKLGGGNLSTIYGEAGIGSIRGKDHETAIHLHHISQKGQIVNQRSSLSGADAAFAMHKPAEDWHAGLSAAHNRYSYYGYDHMLYNYEQEDVRQAYTSVRISAGMDNNKDTSSELSYAPDISASYYAARHNTSEISAMLHVPVTYKLNKSLGLHIDLSGAVASYKADTITTPNNYVIAAPGLKLNTKNFSGHALVGFGLGKGSNGYILPDLQATLELPNLSAWVTGGWKASLRQNTYEQLTTENPYMASLYPVVQTRRDEIFLQVQGGGGDHFAYSAKASWWNYAGLPTFLNDTGDQKTFRLIYQDVQAISAQVSGRYFVARHWSAGLTAELFSFYSSTDLHVWHEPTTRITADVTYDVTKKLHTSLGFCFLGGIHARDAQYNAIVLNPVTDLNINGEYQILPRLSAFLQVNNLLNNKYQRWYGYQVYGINIYGGLRLKF
ncbi:hypothetical protein GCM10023093_28290 [Nemorincola caseinilytica]|uniref:TonB-dependent receptor n=2 Tax=Nemorincola caseinilytica TaxID=2054315 RepID=A0ABP8NLJ4_9BACT